MPVKSESQNYFPISSPYANSGEKTEAMMQNKVLYFIFIQYIFLHTVWFIILVSLLESSYIFKKYTENYHFFVLLHLLSVLHFYLLRYCFFNFAWWSYFLKKRWELSLSFSHFLRFLFFCQSKIFVDALGNALCVRGFRTYLGLSVYIKNNLFKKDK